MTLFEKCIVTSQGVLLTVLGVFGLLHIKQNKKINTLEQSCIQLKTEEERLIFDVLLHEQHMVNNVSLNKDNNTVTITRMTPKYCLSHFRLITRNVDNSLKEYRPLKEGYKYDCAVTDGAKIPYIALARLRLYGELPREYEFDNNNGFTQPKPDGWRVVIKDADDNELPGNQVQNAFATPSMPKPTDEE